jgi:hypothetical protein
MTDQHGRSGFHLCIQNLMWDKATLPKCPEKIIHHSRFFLTASPQIDLMPLLVGLLDQPAYRHAPLVRFRGTQQVEIDPGHEAKLIK